MIALLIGGPADGRRVELPEMPATHRVAEWLNEPILTPGCTTTPRTCVREHVYQRSLTTPRGVTFYLHESLRHEHVVDVLARRYPAKARLP